VFRVEVEARCAEQNGAPTMQFQGGSWVYAGPFGD
jgi:hypothetical protein